MVKKGDKMVAEAYKEFIYINVRKGVEALPVYATEGSAGADIISAEETKIAPGKVKAISTGIFMEIPRGYEVQVRPRSGLAFKSQVTVLNAPGTIDSDYRGELKVILINLGEEDFYIHKGDRIAQMVAAPVVQCRFDIVDELGETERGEGGFGSTDK